MPKRSGYIDQMEREDIESGVTDSVVNNDPESSINNQVVTRKVRRIRKPNRGILSICILFNHLGVTPINSGNFGLYNMEKDKKEDSQIKKGGPKYVSVFGEMTNSFENLNKQFFSWVQYHQSNHPTANWSPFLRVITCCFF